MPQILMMIGWNNKKIRRGAGYDSIIPDVLEDVVLDEVDLEFVANLTLYVQEYVKAMEKAKLKDGLKATMAIAIEGNRYFQKTAVWKLFNEDRLRCSFVIKTLVGVVRVLACLFQPFMPSCSKEVLNQLALGANGFSLREDDIARIEKPWDIVPSGHKIGKPNPLFKKVV
ncbi:unnamed protein product [Cuscuta epithymum]|uniref:Methionyl-tRNA synthetase anticodon-binding domain-containing protein n=1 Tax=Cuscuta epithymum TaxID=186058 RepID=A0AAV0ELB3_9ASTE|nr:unnamed protein product [Cuscuta epithymum]